MRLQYEWTEQEWREAVALASESGSRRQSSVSGGTWALVLLPMLGGAGDLYAHFHGSPQLTLASVTVPVLLLFLGAVALGLVLGMRYFRTRRALAGLPVPRGRCEAVFQEDGWQTMPAGSPSTSGVLESWQMLRAMRSSKHTMILLRGDAGFAAIPLRALNEEQNGHLRRLVERKLRPEVVQRRAGRPR